MPGPFLLAVFLEVPLTSLSEMEPGQSSCRSPCGPPKHGWFQLCLCICSQAVVGMPRSIHLSSLFSGATFLPRAASPALPTLFLLTSWAWPSPAALASAHHLSLHSYLSPPSGWLQRPLGQPANALSCLFLGQAVSSPHFCLPLALHSLDSIVGLISNNCAHLHHFSCLSLPLTWVPHFSDQLTSIAFSLSVTFHSPVLTSLHVHLVHHYPFFLPLLLFPSIALV